MARRREDTEARSRIIREWDAWARTHVPSNRKATGTDGLVFFSHVQKERAELLDFRTKAQDRWQIIHGWLLQAGKVSD